MPIVYIIEANGGFCVRILYSIFAVAIVFAVSNSTALARVSVKETNKYYKVRGKTAPEVFRQITKKGPRHRGLARAVATTAINLKMDGVRIGVRGNRCVVKSLRVKLRLQYKYPKWSNIRQGSKRARANWRTYMKQVIRHERTHGVIAKKLARDVNRSIARLTTRKSRNCTRMGRQIERTFKKLNKEHDRLQTAFDKKEHRQTSYIMKLARKFAFTR